MSGSPSSAGVSTALLTDRYELTMAAAALADGTAQRRCVFEVFARRLPEGRRYGVSTDLRVLPTDRYRPIRGSDIHGYEIGYILHDEDDRGKGYASEGLRLFSDLLFEERPGCHRLQLIIETWNDASHTIPFPSHAALISRAK